MGETVEHELGKESHTATFLRTGDVSSNHDGAVVGSDTFRQNKGIPFVRKTHTKPDPSSKLVK